LMTQMTLEPDLIDHGLIEIRICFACVCHDPALVGAGPDYLYCLLNV
jgi:hypothetical protein